MTVCVEAGLSMEASMVRISEDKQYARTPLGTEMTTAIRETRAGKLRVDALRDMGERAMEEDLRAFAAMLVQTEQLGTNLADSLRIHSDSLRTKRRQKAEEVAAKTAVKLLFPLVFFLMPPLLIIVLLPALIRMGNFFSTMQ
jgi:tight adherence protein C